MSTVRAHKLRELEACGVLLREVVVENFKPFERTSVRLPDHGLTLVAGANNSGKSALLSSLDVIAGASVEGQALRRAGSTSPARVAATFTLDAEERSALFARNPRGIEWVAAGAASQLQLIFEEHDNRHLQLAHVLGEWPGQGLQTFVTIGPRETDGGFGVKLILGLLTADNTREPLLLVDEGGQGAWGGPVSLEQAAGSAQVHSLDVVLQLRSAWAGRYYHFRALRPGTERTSNLAADPTLEPTGENLAAVLLDLLTNRPEILSQLRRLIVDIVPGIGELRVRTTGSQMEIIFARDSVELNLKDLGTGVEQLLMTLVVGLTEAPPFMLVIEEPETNLHHAAQRALLGMLKDWAADRQIVAATHSPVLLDWSPAGDRLWHVTRAHGVSTVAPVRDDPSALLNSLGVRLSDVLSATRVLVLEGPSDEDILGTWFPDVLRNPAVAILHGRGGDNARHADQLAEWLTGVDKIGLRRVLYLRDRDELSPSVLKTLEDSKTVAVLQRRELENYLLDPHAVAKVLGPQVPAGITAPSSSDVAAAFADAGESLRHKIVINRVCRQIGPARLLMEHSLRQGLASHDADQEAVTAAVLERLMTPEQLRMQITAAWRAAEVEVSARSGDNLLSIAPGEEILNEVFQRFAGRGYSKRDDGVAVAKAMSAPPEEIQLLLDAFMLDETGYHNRVTTERPIR
jgi:predicted ATPase